MPLPNEILPIKNVDKQFHEHWGTKRNLLNIPHPFRGVLLGPPNSGKSTVIKNILLRADPPFEHIVIIHCDVDGTQEYDDVKHVMLSTIPQPEDWPGQVKTLVILEDLEFKTLPPNQKKALDRSQTLFVFNF